MPLLRSIAHLAVCCVLCSALMATGATAQQVTVGASAIGGVPHGDFHEQMDRVGFGFSGLVLYGIGPVAAGIEASVLTYDYRSRPLAPMIDGSSAFLGQATTASRIGGLHAVLRLQMPEGPVRPYVDGLAGFQRFATTTHFEQTVLLAAPSIFWPPATAYTQHTRSLEADDVNFSYGAGAGVLIRLARGYDDGVPFNAFLDLGARYIRGEEATYRVVGPASDPADVQFQLVRSRTDLIRPQIGLVIQFGG